MGFSNFFKKKFTPKRNMPAVIYGPPEMLRNRKKDNSEEEEKGFTPEDNYIQVIYGPPEQMGTPAQRESSVTKPGKKS